MIGAKAMLRWRCWWIAALFGVIALAPGARAEEPTSAGVDPEEVARLLLSEREDVRAEGLRLLRERIAAGSDDLDAFLERMAAAQAALFADPHRVLAALSRLGETSRGTGVEAEQAKRLLRRIGPATIARIRRALALPPRARPEPTASEARPGAAEAPDGAGHESTAPTPAPKVPQGPALEVVVEALDARADEVARWLDDRRAGLAAQLARPDVVLLEGDAARAALDQVPGLAESRNLGHGSGAVRGDEETVLLPAERLRWRRAARPTPEGAWAVDADVLPRGLEIRARQHEGGLAIEVRYADVPLPLPTTRVRPAPDVEEVELDRPEWRTVVATVHVPRPGAGAPVVVLVPGLIEGRVVVIGIQTP